MAFGIDDRQGRGQWPVIRCVVIGDDDIDAAVVGGVDGRVTGNPAVDGDDEFECARNSDGGDVVDLKPVALAAAVGNIVFDPATGVTEEFQQDGCARHAVHVVVAEYQNLFVVPQCAGDAPGGDVDVLDFGRRLDVGQGTVQKTAGALDGTDAAIDEQGGRQRVETQIPAQLRHLFRVGRVNIPVRFHKGRIYPNR